MIRKDRGIVVLRYYGYASMSDGAAAISEYNAHRDYDANQKHFIDLTKLDDFQPDYAEALALQAKITEMVMPKGFETFLVICAPTPKAMKLANIIRRSWDGFDWVLIRITETEQDALALLGQKETSISAFLTTA